MISVLVSFLLQCQNTWNNQLTRTKGLFWLAASEPAFHGQLAFTLGPVVYMSRNAQQKKLLTSWQQGSKERQEGVRVPVPLSRACP